MDTTPAELLEHAANLYAQGRFSMTLDPLQFAWRDMHPDTPLVESTYMRASEAISATAGVDHDPALWFTVFSRRNADQVAALLKQSVALAGLPELDQATDVIAIDLDNGVSSDWLFEDEAEVIEGEIE